MNNQETLDRSGIYKIGAVSALIIVLVYLTELGVVVVYGLPPVTVAGWFTLLQTHRLVGLIQSFALDIIAVSFHAPLYIALFFFLRQTKMVNSMLILSVVFAFIGLAVYFASNITFSMLYLSDQFGMATTEAQKSQILTSGQTLLAIYNGTGPFVAYLFNAVAGILVSIVMLQSGLLARTIAILGIVGNTLELGLPPSIDPAFFLRIDPILIGIGGVLLIIWYAALSMKLWREKSDQ